MSQWIDIFYVRAGKNWNLGETQQRHQCVAGIWCIFNIMKVQRSSLKGPQRGRRQSSPQRLRDASNKRSGSTAMIGRWDFWDRFFVEVTTRCFNSIRNFYSIRNSTDSKCLSLSPFFAGFQIMRTADRTVLRKNLRPAYRIQNTAELHYNEARYYESTLWRISWPRIPETIGIS